MSGVVLFVDDEQDFVVNSRIYLQREGYQVVTESDGNAIVNKVREVKPDVVVLDVNLGVDALDGRIICRELCKLPAYLSGAMKIILISGHYVTSFDEVLGFDIGADNYLVKPFQMAQLAAMINACLRRSRPSCVSTMAIDDCLSIDYPCRSVSLNGKSIAFTQLEFDFFSFLAKPPNQVRTKYELLDAVWKTQDIEEGAISKCVHLIRKKISPKRTEQYIKTVFGVGYVLNSNIKRGQTELFKT